MLPGVISMVAQVLNAQETLAAFQENSTASGSAETCPTEGHRHLTHGAASGFPLPVVKLSFVRDLKNRIIS